MGRDINGACGQLRNEAMKVNERRKAMSREIINAFGKSRRWINENN